MIRFRVPGSVFNRRLAALMTPWQVPQIVMTSRPSASACANVLALKASAMSGCASVTTPAPQQAADVQFDDLDPQLADDRPRRLIEFRCRPLRRTAWVEGIFHGHQFGRLSIILPP